MPVSAAQKITFRESCKEDGAAIWTLVRDSAVLDLNSAYSYLMMCHYFPETFVVAEEEGEIVGFVSAYIPQSKPDVVFVWQVAVAQSQRGKGLATLILKELLQRDACKKVRFMESTVTPSNQPSQSLFQGLARELKTSCDVSECFPVQLFPESGHEAEMLFRIGPFDSDEVLG